VNSPGCTTVGCTGSCPDNAYLCPSCTVELRELLAGMPQLLEELETTITRQARVGGGDGGRKSAETQVPFHGRAGQLVSALRSALGTWARHVAETRGVPIQVRRTIYGPYHPLCPHETCAQIQRLTEHPEGVAAVWMAGHVDWLRHRQEVTEAFAELVSMHRRCVQVIDRAPERWYGGPCDLCGVDLYAMPGAPYLDCRTPGCDARYDSRERREWLIQSAEDTLATTTVIAQALSALGDDQLTPSMIRQMAFRKQIVSHGMEAPRLSYNSDGKRVTRQEKLYRVGDVVTIMIRRRMKKAS
jgi:hypothetical protein